MSDYFMNNQTMEVFNQTFPQLTLNYQPVHIRDAVAHAFFIEFKTIQQVESNWERITTFLAIHFQATLTEDFGRWNIYLFLICPPLPIELKFKIENNTLSSRKIIVDIPANFDQIKDEHILCKDLGITFNATRNQAQFTPDKKIWDLLNGKTLKNKKRTGIAQEMFDELLRILKNDLV